MVPGTYLDHIRRAGDFQKYYLYMDDAEFDYHLEFAYIQKIFPSVIIKEVILDTGLSYCGEGRPQNSHSTRCLSTQVGLLDQISVVSLIHENKQDPMFLFYYHN
jgi:hypothetical protein